MIESAAAEATSATHVYQGATAAYAVHVEANISGSAYALSAIPVSVANLNPCISINGPSSINEGSPWMLCLTASDPGQDSLTYTVDWGDGETGWFDDLEYSLGLVRHVYADNSATYRTITVTAYDPDGGDDDGNASGHG